jgi:hypothetical protein
VAAVAAAKMLVKVAVAVAATSSPIWRHHLLMRSWQQWVQAVVVADPQLMPVLQLHNVMVVQDNHPPSLGTRPRTQEWEELVAKPFGQTTHVMVVIFKPRQ